MAEGLVHVPDSLVKPDPLDLEQVFREGTRQLIYLDTSASMTDYLAGGASVFGRALSRGEAAVHLLVDFLRSWSGTFDLCQFSSRVRSLSQVEDSLRRHLRNGDEAAARAAFDSVPFNGADTLIYTAFLHAAKRVELKRATEMFEVLLLTDGYDIYLCSWTPSVDSPLTQTMRKLRESLVRVSVFHILPKDSLDNYQFCQEPLREICRLTGGRYVQAFDAESFRAAMVSYKERSRLPEGLRLLTEGEGK